MTGSHDITLLLRQLSAGRREAFEELMPVLYEELRGLARAALSDERPDHTLGTTALVHEAYMRLVRIREVEWNDRAHFFAVAARAMRRVLADHAKARRRVKRGGGTALHLPVEAAGGVAIGDIEEILTLESVLSRLEAMNERYARVVELRVFAGFTIHETAAALKISPASVKRDWAFSRAWLNQALASESSDGEDRDRVDDGVGGIPSPEAVPP